MHASLDDMYKSAIAFDKIQPMAIQRPAPFQYPLLLNPIPVPRPWGAGKASKIFKRDGVQSNQPIGEWWDASTWPEDPGNPGLATVSIIANGPLAGTRLNEIIELPVVAKLIDSAQSLSVQVHPVAPDMHKDEMWYILDADPGAYLYCGLAEGADPQDLCNAIRTAKPENETVLKLLHRADDIQPGMHFNVPSGTVHAVGPGLIAFEVSERAQITYRLFDYNSSRKLHIEEGCEAVLNKRMEIPELIPALKIEKPSFVELLSAFPSFCVLRVQGDNIAVQSIESYHLITASTGDCRLKGPDVDWDILIPQSFTALLPPMDAPYGIDARSGGEVLITTFI
jgi:mannose-6-phosphate isomerase